MEVSTFELLYKPLTPTGGDIARRVLQGYFLTMTNLEDRDYCFRFEFVATPPSPFAPERTLDAPQAIFIADVASPDNVFSALIKIGSSTRYFQDVTVGAGRTALIIVLPDITLPDFFAAAPANQEVRGYVRVTVPYLVKCLPDGKALKPVPQSDKPVKVLLNPELRATYLPNGWPSALMSTDDFDQTITALTVASGKGLNEIAPSKCYMVIDDQVTEGVLKKMEHMSAALDPLERLAETVAGLAELADAEGGPDALNRLLEQAGVPLSVGQRKGERQ
jgi:hypothetical protein